MNKITQDFSVHISKRYFEFYTVGTKKNNYDFEIIGGIADYKHPNWRINKQENYVYENESDWEILKF